MLLTASDPNNIICTTVASSEVTLRQFIFITITGSVTNADVGIHIVTKSKTYIKEFAYTHITHINYTVENKC